MKLFVINGKRKIVCLLVLAGICLLMALTAFHEDMAGVFASKREIPYIPWKRMRTWPH